MFSIFAREMVSYGIAAGASRPSPARWYLEKTWQWSDCCAERHAILF